MMSYRCAKKITLMSFQIRIRTPKKSNKRTKQKKQTLMMTRDYQSELVSKKNKTKQTFHKYYGK